MAKETEKGVTIILFYLCEIILITVTTRLLDCSNLTYANSFTKILNNYFIGWATFYPLNKLSVVLYF